jgi:multidrug resistance efflux pump
VLFWICCAVVLAALGLAIGGSIEATTRGQGVVRATAGIRQLVAQGGGTVSRVETRSGDAVPAGAPVLRLASASLEAKILEADRNLQMLSTDFQRFSGRQDHLFEDQAGLVKGRVAMLEEQVASQRQSVALAERKLEANQELKKAGLVSALNLEDAKEAVAQIKRSLNTVCQSLNQARQEAAALDARRQEDLWKREQDMRAARTARDAVALSLREAQVLSPVEGWVEALLVKDGDVVQTGQVLARIVPKEAPLEVIVFLPEKDRGFVNAGDPAKLELEQFPYAEFGTVPVRVERIAEDLASSYEVREAMGDDAKLASPAYRVELSLGPPPVRHGKAVRIRSGMLASVRFTLRKQRPIVLFLEPLKRWLQ